MVKNDNMKLWDEVCVSDPAQLKKVSMRGGFISIDAHSQVKAVTEAFGACGEGWKFETEEIVTEGDYFMVKVSVFRKLKYTASEVELMGATIPLWSAPVVQYGCQKWGTGPTAQDTPKKAVTDGLTKCFSYWGFNADVFMGEWDKRDLDKEQAVAARATLTKSDANKQIALMKEFNELVEDAPEEVQVKARKFIEDNPTNVGIEKAINRLKAVDKASEA